MEEIQRKFNHQIENGLSKIPSDVIHIINDYMSESDYLLCILKKQFEQCILHLKNNYCICDYEYATEYTVDNFWYGGSIEQTISFCIRCHNIEISYDNCFTENVSTTYQYYPMKEFLEILIHQLEHRSALYKYSHIGRSPLRLKIDFFNTEWCMRKLRLFLSYSIHNKKHALRYIRFIYLKILSNIF